MSLLDEIQAKCPQALIDAREHGQIAALVSQGRTRIVSTLVGIGSVIEALGLADGPALLDALNELRSVIPAVRWGWVLLERSALDIGSPATRSMIDNLAGAGTLTAAQAEALKSLAVQAAPVSVAEVISALEGA